MTEVTRRWLEAPYELDGWRVDVANMVGRYRESRRRRASRARSGDASGEKLLVAEHGHDFRADLQGDGWHGDDELLRLPAPGLDVAARRRAAGGAAQLLLEHPGRAAAPAGRRGRREDARASAPGSRGIASSTRGCCSTATTRALPHRRRLARAQLVGVGLQMTTPGVPMVFAGDELGLEGDWGEDARRTMPWSRPETWDTTPLEGYRALIALRRSSAALAHGGMRYAHVSADAIAYLREAPGERLLCLAARAGHEPIRLPLAALGCTALETLHGGDADLGGGDAVLPARRPRIPCLETHVTEPKEARRG